jgi:hypothetical protein
MTARFAAFVIVAVVIIAWISAGNNEYASAARFFLRQLFRQMF